MKKILLLVLGLGLSLFTACDSVPAGRLNATKMVEITSVPEGASIIVNNINLGKTPLSVEFAMNEFGCFIRQVTITALAQEPSLFTQVKSYPRFTANTEQESKVPEKIIFDMSVSPLSKSE
ncbi:MAG: PEGA domain-containing protein [Opitutales bacterium]